MARTNYDLGWQTSDGIHGRDVPRCVLEDLLDTVCWVEASQPHRLDLEAEKHLEMPCIERVFSVEFVLSVVPVDPCWT